MTERGTWSAGGFMGRMGRRSRTLTSNPTTITQRRTPMIGTGRKKIPARTPVPYGRGSDMETENTRKVVGDRQYVAGWLESSIHDFLEALPGRPGSMAFALVT